MNAEQASRIGVAILAKAPIAGFAKTRLIPRLGPQGAALLQRWLLQRTVDTAMQAAIGPVSLWCAPDVDHPEFARFGTDGVIALQPQPSGDLGERMHAAIAESPTLAGTLVIGTDCPLLSPELLRQAAASLDEHDATVVPAEDGGYVLIGLRRAARQVFERVAWSSAEVMAQTRERLTELNWRWAEFSSLWDVDRDADFVRLAELFPELQTLGSG
ncbi:MAG: TIGR04282 family arsenosugar biosynthesis glycosyltransferase [Dechloromonas sp.]|nr:TIGR04282 family arsenosugar biosynthesis glycosyltransferase [Dechloromonas sp.]